MTEALAPGPIRTYVHRVKKDFSKPARPVSSEPAWCNSDNQKTYYEVSPIEKVLAGFARMGGLDRGIDVDMVLPYLKTATRILEAGPGYGRVLKRLLDHHLPGSIEAVERSQLLYKTLKPLQSKIKIFHSNILDFRPSQLYDAVISMWSGISDFAPSEQPQFFYALANLLAPNGYLLMDTSCAWKKPLNALSSSGQTYFIIEEGCLVKGYIPNDHEMFAYAQQAGVSLRRCFLYRTATDRERIMYVFQKLL